MSAEPAPRSGFQFWKRRIDDAVLMRLRLVSGLILLAYVVVHFSNHALGLISDDLMRRVMRVTSSIVGSPPVSIALYGSFCVHILLSLWKVYQRRTLKMPVREWAQLMLGLAIPYFMITHVVGTRFAEEFYGISASYDYVLLSVFVFAPEKAWVNGLGLLAAWIHGCIGFHMWLQTKPWYSVRVRYYLLIVASLLPTLSLTGYLAAGQRIVPMADDGEFMGEYYERLNWVTDDVWMWITRDIQWTEWAFYGLIALVVSGQIIRHILTPKRQTVSISYVDGPTVAHPIGDTLLDISKFNNVPHANVCGGRGRCSTCRVRLLTENPELDPPNESELRVLKRVSADDDVRLACQISPKGDLQVMRLLPSDTSAVRAEDNRPWSSGREKLVSVMFVDIREFTKTSESRLPFDVVYLINQFSQAMGGVVEKHNGRIDKFLGDGFMALFGVEEKAENSTLDAINAAGEMIEELELLNEKLAGDLDQPLRIGIGIHFGSVILGDMGYGSSRGLTALGDTVNTASRLEAATKELKCNICISALTVKTAGLVLSDETKKLIAVRGKKDKLEVHALMQLEDSDLDRQKVPA